MFDANHIVNNIFNAQIPFEQLALDVFYYQYQHNAVYQQWCRQLCINDPFTIQNVAAIPYLPIHFFKTHQLITS
ncbi:MAG TPA: acyl transferase, partial [Chitinophagaceae bacterium]|nr:acyl transferase [Chitinophagaceae bacterium]